MRRPGRLAAAISLVAVLLAAVGALVAVRWWADGEQSTGGDRIDQPAFTLQLLHAGDMDGAVGALENVENFSAVLDGFRRQLPDNTLVLSSGTTSFQAPDSTRQGTRLTTRCWAFRVMGVGTSPY